jgi:hypothetical protein
MTLLIAEFDESCYEVLNQDTILDGVQLVLVYCFGHTDGDLVFLVLAYPPVRSFGLDPGGCHSSTVGFGIHSSHCGPRQYYFSARTSLSSCASRIIILSLAS